MVSCGGLSTRLGGIGILVGRRVGNPPQNAILPHEFRRIAHARHSAPSETYSSLG